MTTETDNAAAGPAPATQQQATPSFGQRIETALVTAWNEAKAEGEQLLAKAEEFGEQELTVVENAIVNTWNTYAPKAVALLKTYVSAALAQIGSGASIEQVAESAVAQDAASAEPFLEGAVSAGLKAVVAGLIASL